VRADVAAVRLDDLANDGESDPGATGRTRSRPIDTMEPLPDEREVGARNIGAAVGD